MVFVHTIRIMEVETGVGGPLGLVIYIYIFSVRSLVMEGKRGIKAGKIRFGSQVD